MTDKITDIYPQAKIVGPVVQPEAEQAKRVAQAEQQTKSVAIAPEAKAAVPDTALAPQKTWKGHVDAGINIKDGNTESTTTHVKGGYANERKRDNIYFDALALYETITEKDSDEDTETVNEQRASGKSDDYLGVRVGQYLDWLLLIDTKFYAKNEYIQSVEDTDDWRLDSGLGVRHNLTKSIALSTELLNQYDNTPPEGNQKDDTIIIGSVGYNF